MKKFWGYHLMLDCANCNKEKIKDIEHIKKFVKAIIKGCKMKPLGDMLIEDLQVGAKEILGYSIAQFIHTSSITCHFADYSGNVYLDVFSCKPFDPSVVMAIMTKYFNPEKTNKHFIVRDADL